MIVLDTNVISALMRGPGQDGIVDWFDRQPAESVWTTTVTVFEIRLGLESLPASRRRGQLETLFEQVLAEDLQERVLPFDSAAAEEAASLAARRRAAGRPMELRDTMIAGIVIARNATLATRNIRHFADLGDRVVDPWADQAT